MTLKVLDLFSGIGGFSYAAEHLVGGFETTQFVEIDTYCQRVLHKNFPNVPIHHDITEFNATEGQFQVITAGFPCQDSALQVDKTVLERVQEVGYSLKSSDWLGRYDLSSSSLKMLEIYSLTPKGRPSSKSSKKLPKQGLMLSGRLFRQQIWQTPVTKENVSGLLPTPLGSTKIEQKVPFKQGGTPLLAALLTLPTPTARDYKDSGPNTNYEKGSEEETPCWSPQPHTLEPDWRRYLSQPTICRGDDGFSNRMDRLKCLGNSIVPQAAAVPLARIKQLNTILY
jgi:hypothetical protein